jgi:hypothetical protein
MKHATGHEPGQHVTVGQCCLKVNVAPVTVGHFCFEGDRTERRYEGPFTRTVGGWLPAGWISPLLSISHRGGGGG